MDKSDSIANLALAFVAGQRSNRVYKPNTRKWRGLAPGAFDRGCYCIDLIEEFVTHLE
jgi:hypothetical protein